MHRPEHREVGGSGRSGDVDVATGIDGHGIGLVDTRPAQVGAKHEHGVDHERPVAIPVIDLERHQAVGGDQESPVHGVALGKLIQHRPFVAQQLAAEANGQCAVWRHLDLAVTTKSQADASWISAWRHDEVVLHPSVGAAVHHVDARIHAP